MYFSKIEISGFGKLKNFKMSLSKGLNVIFGGNESGKSTLHIFIRAMLYGLEGGRTTKDGLMPPLKRLAPWDGGDFGGFLEYVLDSGESFRVSRNFNTGAVKVYDANFNDVTGQFMSAGLKDVEPGARHLGLNADCFERTIFIGQMQTRLDRKGSDEIISRLVNAGLTGYDDVSLNRAVTGLKDAIKEYAGTGKTTTRPLDIINERLAELDEAIRKVVSKRDSIQETENRIKQAAQEREKLRARKITAEKAEGIIELTLLKKHHEQREAELVEIRDRLIKLQNDYEQNAKILNKLNSEKQVYVVFKDYDREDADDALSCFEKLMYLEEDLGRMENAFRQAESKRAEAEARLKECSSYEKLGKDGDTHVLNLLRELAGLRELKADDNRLLAKQIEDIKFRKKVLGLNLAGVVLLTVGLIAGGLLYSRYLLYAGMGTFAVAVAIAAFLLKAKSHLKKLVYQRRNNYLTGRKTEERIEQLQGELDSIFSKVGTDNYEGFLKVRNQYEMCRERLDRAESELAYLGETLRSKRKQVEEMREKLLDMFLKTGIAKTKDEKITERHIREFKAGIERNVELDQKIQYCLKKEDSIDEERNNLYRRASRILEADISDMGELDGHVAGATDSRLNMDYNLEVEMYEFKKLLDAADHSEHSDSECREIYELLNLGKTEEARTKLRQHRPEIENRLAKIEREIAVSQSIVDSAPGEDFLQRLEEERAGLLEKKSDLEDLAFSLQAALDGLNEAALEIKKNFSPRLNSKMGEIISKITRGRYSDIRTDDSLVLKAQIPANSEVLPVLNLSGGTADQMYLALRLALSELLADKEELPVILDEAFAQYDEERLYETLDYLSGISKKKQVIIFTCRNREVEIASSVCGNLNLVNF